MFGKTAAEVARLPSVSRIILASRPALGSFGVDEQSSGAGAVGGRGIIGATVSVLPKKKPGQAGVGPWETMSPPPPPLVCNSLAGKPVASLARWFSCNAEAPRYGGLSSKPKIRNVSGGRPSGVSFQPELRGSPVGQNYSGQGKLLGLR